MKLSSETGALFAALRESAKPEPVTAIEKLVENAPDRALCRINALAFAAEHNLDEEDVIAAFLHAAQLGIFDLSWNVLCPGCGGVLDSGTTLKTVNQADYSCALCAAAHEPTLDEMVEVTFTISPRVRNIAAHDPQTLPWIEYFRQLFWSSGVDLPDDDTLAKLIKEITLHTVELLPSEKVELPLQVPEAFLIVFDPVLHTSRPGPLRISLENRSSMRALPGIWIAGNKLHSLLGKRRPFLTAKRLLTNQTFRDIYRTDTLAVDQRLKITSLTFLFTDLKGSTELYERVGDLAAYDLVRAHFHVLNEIVAAERGAEVKTIGDAVMATFPTPDRAIAAALMRDAVKDLNGDLLLKIGIHEGPCLAVSLNDRQDYFGQTVNIAARVQGLATSRSIFATSQVVAHNEASQLLQANGIAATPQTRALRGITNQFEIFEIP